MPIESVKMKNSKIGLRHVRTRPKWHLEPKFHEAGTFGGWEKRGQTDTHTQTRFMFYKYRFVIPISRPGYRGGQRGHLARAPRSREGAPFPGGARQGAPLGSIFAVLNSPHGIARQCAPCGRLCASQTLPVGASCFKDYDSTLSATKVVSASTPYKLF